MPGHLRPYLNTRNSARASNSLWTSHEPCASGIIREAKSDQQTRIKKSQRLSQGFTSPRNLSVARYLNSGAREAGMSLGHILASHDVQHRRAVIIATRRARPSRLQAIRRYLAGDAKRLVARFNISTTPTSSPPVNAIWMLRCLRTRGRLSTFTWTPRQLDHLPFGGGAWCDPRSGKY